MVEDESKCMWPIIYVRGYAMTKGEIDETTADPFCGFNLGSTVYRATSNRKAPPKKLIFESPVVRLGIDFQYNCVFNNGYDIVDLDWERKDIPLRSIIIFRYYEQASELIGTGKTPPIEQFAKDLGKLIVRVRDLVCARPGNNVSKDDFRCYLVAHSMGGLVCRAFLQNPPYDPEKPHECVDKVFTYATPHNGIEVAGLNVPGWLETYDMANFNRKRIAEYLNLGKLYKEGDEDARVDWLPEKAFKSERFFCLVGTNREDYQVAMGLSRAFAGHGSDGLVRIENASVWGIDENGKASAPCATAYVYRAHSGHFGIVNSEEAYQNLVRFLFGDVRVDIWLDVAEVRLPPDVQAEADKNKKIEALYQFEVLASPRGKRWYLTRRVAEEDSVACRTLEQLRSADPSARSIYLSTVFLANRARVNPDRKSLAYAVTLGARVPDYEVEGRFWGQNHYEGGYLYQDTVIVEMFPPENPAGDWKVTHGWSKGRGKKEISFPAAELANGMPTLSVEFDATGAPGISGRLRFIGGLWNVPQPKGKG